MKVGTKSVLFGAHCFFIHPWFVGWAWWRLFGFPWDPRLWVAFFVHDLGYWGMPNMDGEEGERHPHFGAGIMGRLFDKPYLKFFSRGPAYHLPWRDWPQQFEGETQSWYCFTFYHSRFLCKEYGHRPTKLCIADKLSVALEPWWFYLPRAIASGEIKEYMKRAGKRRPSSEQPSKYDGEPTSKYESMKLETSSRRAWFDAMTSYLRRWVEEHKDGRDDNWTPNVREARDENGVYS